MVKSPNSSLSSFDQVESTSRSSASSGSDENQKQSKKKNNSKQIAGGILLFITTAYFIGTIHPQINFDNVQFDFYVHCPVSYELKHLQESSTLQELKNNRFSTLTNLREKYKEKLNNTYVVRMRARSELSLTGNLSEIELRLKYCSYSRPWDGTCQKDAKFICSNPGPAFDVEENQNITVFWVNEIDLKNFTQEIQNIQSKGKDTNQCYKNEPENLHYDVCTKKGKTKAWENLTYLDPTDLGICTGNCQTSTSDSIQGVPSERKQVPTSTHVHGLEVRPLFDGNPLSWFDRNNDNVKDSHLGTGFMSADDPYFDFLTNQHEFSEFQRYLRIKDSPQKVNMYPNKQQPGTLWYHDHAMGVTSMNVRLGLTSFYIIRNKQVQKDLPKGQYEKLAYIYDGFNESKIFVDCNQACKHLKSFNQSVEYIGCLNNCTMGKINYTDKIPKEEDRIVKKIDPDTVKADKRYRFRILNGDYDQTYRQVSFQCYNETKNMTLNVTVIGTDSALRKESAITDNLYLASAERADVLVDFNECAKQNYGFAGVYINTKKGSAYLRRFKIIGKPDLSIVANKPVNLTVPFTDLRSKQWETKVSVKRMRPLVRAVGGGGQDRQAGNIPNSAFGINGHLRFHMGASENPKIGSVEDWYLINTISFGHPIHIHLIQFQIIEYYQLRVAPGGCTYYLIDFVRDQSKTYLNGNNGYETENGTIDLATSIVNAKNVSQACSIFQKKSKTILFIDLFRSFKNDAVITDPNAVDPTVSGIDINDLVSSKQEKDFFGLNQGEHKYITNDSVDLLKQYQMGWKDTVWVDTFTVARVRIRWASTDMTQEQFSDPVKACKKGYFKIPEEDLIEFPGFLYHCHILKHEDNEMMRPIMMQPSDCNKTLPWKEKWKGINREILQRGKSSRTNELRMR